ncbi:MAG TPA: MFS transporter [Myxococcota bacterium]|nr:MFS transporter [Myxococcota bacterium]
MVDSPVEESLGANPAEAALNPVDPVAMGVPADRVPGFLGSSKGRAFRALAHEPFRLLYAAFLINQTGFWISHISLQALMVELTNDDPLYLGRLSAAIFTPAFFLAPLAGVTADRYDRRKIVLVCYAAVSTLMLLLAAFSGFGVITPVLALALSFLLGTAFCFAGPSSFAVAANTVPVLDLPSAVSLQSAANNLTRVLGPVLAAPLLATHHFELAFCIFGATSLISAALIARIQIRPNVPQLGGGGIFARLRVGFTHARERRPALPALLTVAGFSVFGVSHITLLPVYAERVLGHSNLFVWIVVASGIGALVGALVAGYSRHSTLRSCGIQLMLYGLALTGFACAPSWLPLAFAIQVVIGFFYFSVMTHLQTLVQQIVDDDKRGRVTSLFQVAWAGLIPFGALAMGGVATSAGVVATLAGAGACCVAIGGTVAAGARRWSSPLPLPGLRAR